MWCYCSRKCRDDARTLKRSVFACKQCEKPVELSPASIRQRESRNTRHVFCSSSCSATFYNTCRKKPKTEKRSEIDYPVELFSGKLPKPRGRRRCKIRCILTCEGCGEEVYRTRVDIEKKSKHGKSYCSKSCRMRHYNHHVLVPTGRNKSRAETILSDMIRACFPTLEVQQNVRTLLTNGLEIDIYLPQCKLAIELNGPTHYVPIYGHDALEKTQSKDRIKQRELQNNKIGFLIIDISQLKNVKQTTGFLSKHYQECVKPLIEERLGINGPVVGNAPT